jgi:hypothetical protein
MNTDKCVFVFNVYNYHFKTNKSSDQDWFFIITLILVNIATCKSYTNCFLLSFHIQVASNGLVLAGTFGLAARYPSHIMQATMIGQSLVGIAASSASICAQLMTPNPQGNGLAYFSIGAVYTLLSLAAYLGVMRTVCCVHGV